MPASALVILPDVINDSPFHHTVLSGKRNAVVPIIAGVCIVVRLSQSLHITLAFVTFEVSKPDMSSVVKLLHKRNIPPMFVTSEVLSEDKSSVVKLLHPRKISLICVTREVSSQFRFTVVRFAHS